MIIEKRVKKIEKTCAKCSEYKNKNKIKIIKINAFANIKYKFYYILLFIIFCNILQVSVNETTIQQQLANQNNLEMPDALFWRYLRIDLKYIKDLLLLYFKHNILNIY